jgi:hypothetical protein
MLSWTSSTSSGLSNCSRKAPVETAVVSVAAAGRFSTMTVESPARDAKKAVAQPMIPPPMTAMSAVRPAEIPLSELRR